MRYYKLYNTEPVAITLTLKSGGEIIIPSHDSVVCETNDMADLFGRLPALEVTDATEADFKAYTKKAKDLVKAQAEAEAEAKTRADLEAKKEAKLGSTKKVKGKKRA